MRPTSAMASLQITFTALTTGPKPLALETRSIVGLPGASMPLDRLRDLLREGKIPPDSVDVVWRRLSANARHGDPQWVVGALGVALPGLRRMASRLGSAHPRHAADIEAELLMAFLHELRMSDLDRPRLWQRWCWAAWRSAKNAVRADETSELPPERDSGSRTPLPPYGHPDLVLGRAVAAGVLTAEQAELISATRFGGVHIEQLAADAEVSPAVLRMRRRRAELKIAAALGRPLDTESSRSRERGSVALGRRSMSN
ncbi:hypothetical protein HDA40_001912 [Hamadaea flava]|uniref:Sigma-70 family RNA polymerase sigma factor n=1 Tax=Hamadaea flava TaxID=1742688 RepID=A0ABV8LFN9_9ACTN|nr:hypothetical protein [Hamadaea flava]MCP2323405.1 hypothetical protein [Hamadaea flava]